MAEIFSDLPEALANTQEIVDKIELYDIDHAPIFPKLEISSSHQEYLRQQVLQGGKERYGEEFVHSHAFTQRAETELNALCAKEDTIYYLLIVADLVNAARNMNIMVGPGRSSAAGSLVLYCLKITDIDPLKYGLLFERFYTDNEALPDIDIDVEDGKRENLIDYLSQKYGESHVAQICNWRCTKGDSWRLIHIGRALQIPKERINVLMKDDHQILETNERKAIKYLQQLTGIGIDVSYTCGVAICGEELPNLLPLCNVKDINSEDARSIVTGYGFKDIEDLGVVKLDILGLYALTTINECLRKIKQVHGIELNLNAIPMDDKATLQIFQEGRTAGVFQFESRGIQNVLRQLHPDNFEELVAVNTMYRPGPETYIQPFINRKHDKEPISYELPVMEKYLKETKGFFLYQEQLMQMCQEIAGFTPKESDQFRKDSGRLGKSPLAEIWKHKFIDGGIANGHDEKALKNIWMKWEKSRLYAYNKSHVLCYTWLAYQMAYLKAHFPDAFHKAVEK